MDLVPIDLASCPGTVYGPPGSCDQFGSDIRIVRHSYGADCRHDKFCYTRPLWVAWVAPLTDGCETLLARQSRSTRKRSRSIMRRAGELNERIEDEVVSNTLVEWKHVYDQQISSMPTGLNVVDKYSSLDNLSHLTFAGYFDSNGMQAGALFDVRSDPSILRMRLAAATKSARDAGLLRALYHRVADYGASMYCESMMMGFDPNLFGYVVQPGLCVFKLQMGFDPVPAQKYADNSDYTDVTERVVGPVGVDGSPLLFEYADRPAKGEALRLVGIRFSAQHVDPIDNGLVRRWIDLC